MKHLTQPPGKETKETTFKFRVSTQQKIVWEEAVKELRFDLSSYIRFAVDRAIAADLRSKDPRWRAFSSAVNEKSGGALHPGLENALQNRIEAYNRVEEHLKKHHR